MSAVVSAKLEKIISDSFSTPVLWIKKAIEGVLNFGLQTIETGALSGFTGLIQIAPLQKVGYHTFYIQYLGGCDFRRLQ